MKVLTYASAALMALALAACGGGASSNVTPAGVVPMPTPTPGAPSPGSAPASQATIKGAAAWVTPTNNLTLYVWAGDSAGMSNCTGNCAAAWPPFMAAAGATASGSFTIITRSDGSKQWAYKNAPLYNFSGDSAAGQANGDGSNAFGALWSVARP